MGESRRTIQRSPRISTKYKFAAPRYQMPPMALQTAQVSVEPRLSTEGIERSLSRAIVPKTMSRSARLCYHVSNSVVFAHRAETLAKGYPAAIQAVLKGRTIAIRKGNKWRTRMEPRRPPVCKILLPCWYHAPRLPCVLAGNKTSAPCVIDAHVAFLSRLLVLVVFFPMGSSAWQCFV